MSETTTLLSAHIDAIDPQAAIETAFPRDVNSRIPQYAAGLLYTPQACVIGCVADGVLESSDGFDWNDVFEMRWFDEAVDLRWRRDPQAEQNVGMAAVVTEEATRLPSGWIRLDDLSDCRRGEEQRYLLWGTTSATSRTNWVQCWEARLKPFLIPLPPGVSVGEDVRLALRFVEYVMYEPTFGNAYVGEERLLGFVPYA